MEHLRTSKEVRAIGLTLAVITGTLCLNACTGGQTSPTPSGQNMPQEKPAADAMPTCKGVNVKVDGRDASLAPVIQNEDKPGVYALKMVSYDFGDRSQEPNGDHTTQVHHYEDGGGYNVRVSFTETVAPGAAAPFKDGTQFYCPVATLTIVGG